MKHAPPPRLSDLAPAELRAALIARDRGRAEACRLAGQRPRGLLGKLLDWVRG